MCQHLMILVERGARQYVGQCEHGTVHLTWGLAILNMRPDDFAQLAGLLASCLDHDDFTPLQGGAFRIFCVSNGAFQLWIGTIGLYFTRGDLAVFTQMLDEARQLLALAVPRHQCGVGLGNDFQIMRVHDNISFGAN